MSVFWNYTLILLFKFIHKCYKSKSFNIASYSNVSFMKKKKSKKVQAKSNRKNQELGQTKNSAKLVLFVFGIGPIIGIIIFLYSKGFFNSPTI